MGEVAENALSPRIYSVSFGAGSAAADQEYRYYYGNRGNITQINSKNAAGSWEAILNYHYDANQQLTRVNDKLNNVSIRYTYDAQGNITKRQYYPYSTGTLGTATRTDTWTYGGLDGNVLVSSTIDGETTTYTRPYYGMPSTWTGGRAITWQNGTDMASIGNVTFAYDDGQRVSKTDASGIVTKYVYEGDTLKMMKRGSRYLVFLYDQNGVFGFDYQLTRQEKLIDSNPVYGVLGTTALKDEADTNGNGSTSQEEAEAYLDRKNFSMSQKALLFKCMCPNAKHNKYE